MGERAGGWVSMCVCVCVCLERERGWLGEAVGGWEMVQVGGRDGVKEDGWIGRGTRVTGREGGWVTGRDVGWVDGTVTQRVAYPVCVLLASAVFTLPSAAGERSAAQATRFTRTSLPLWGLRHRTDLKSLLRRPRVLRSIPEDRTPFRARLASHQIRHAFRPCTQTVMQHLLTCAVTHSALRRKQT